MCKEAIHWEATVSGKGKKVSGSYADKTEVKKNSVIFCLMTIIVYDFITRHISPIIASPHEYQVFHNSIELSHEHFFLFLPQKHGSL